MARSYTLASSIPRRRHQAPIKLSSPLTTANSLTCSGAFSVTIGPRVRLISSRRDRSGAFGTPLSQAVSNLNEAVALQVFPVLRAAFDHFASLLALVCADVSHDKGGCRLAVELLGRDQFLGLVGRRSSAYASALRAALIWAASSVVCALISATSIAVSDFLFWRSC